jgi:hypothetical protein
MRFRERVRVGTGFVMGGADGGRSGEGVSGAGGCGQVEATDFEAEETAALMEYCAARRAGRVRAVSHEEVRQRFGLGELR